MAGGRHRQGSRNKDKSPKAAFDPATSPKSPREPDYDHDDVLKRKPLWRFQLVDHDGPWGFDQIAPDSTVGLLRKLANFESMTIGELFFRGDEPGKSYEVDQMPSRVAARLVEIERDDETRLSRLRLDGACRLYGILREHVFYVLWWDPQHEVYPSQLKHT